MRIGILSDIHGNADALQAVLVDASARHVDRWLNLGDTFYGPLDPLRTADLLATMDVLTIQGNQDRQLYEALSTDTVSNPTIRHVQAELGGERIDGLRKLPLCLSSEHDLLACHGSPQSDLQYLIEDVTLGFPRVRAEPDLERQLCGAKASLIACGHTHIPRIVRLQNGTMIVNPGSVGLPAYSDELPVYHQMETYSPNASYAIVSFRTDGWCVELYSVPYDFGRAAQQATRIGRSDWAYWLSSGRCCRSPR
jgi:predicted phosphodiesterase